SDADTGAADTQTVHVANVAPTVVLDAGNDLNVSEGSTQHTYSYSISDPGHDTIRPDTTHCATSYAKVALQDQNTHTTGSFYCTFADRSAPPTSPTRRSADLSDADTGAADTQTVHVANVAPTVVLDAGNDLNVSEGSTQHTYSYSISD